MPRLRLVIAVLALGLASVLPAAAEQRTYATPQSKPQTSNRGTYTQPYTYGAPIRPFSSDWSRQGWSQPYPNQPIVICPSGTTQQPGTNICVRRR